MAGATSDELSDALSTAEAGKARAGIAMMLAVVGLVVSVVLFGAVVYLSAAVRRLEAKLAASGQTGDRGRNADGTEAGSSGVDDADGGAQSQGGRRGKDIGNKEEEEGGVDRLERWRELTTVHVSDGSARPAGEARKRSPASSLTSTSGSADFGEPALNHLHKV